VAGERLASANSVRGRWSPGFRVGLRWLSGIAVICGSLWFMVSQLSLNLGRLGAELTQIPAWGIAVTTFIFAASVLVDNVIWYSILRSNQGQALSLTDAFAVLNLSAVGKYLPGKVWAYAWQIYLLDRRGISPRASLWTNALTALAAAAAGALVGGVTAAVGHLGTPIVILSLATGIALFGLMPLHERLRIVARLEKRLGFDLSYATFRWQHWLLAVAGYCGMMVIWGLGAVVLAASLQPGISLSTGAAVIAGMCLSWLIGTLVAIAPAGLGVREAAMALALANLPGRLGLVLPIATRILLIVVDLALEAVALAILWYRRTQPLRNSD